MLCALIDCVSTPVLWIMSYSALMIGALLHWDHSHTLSNGLNELTKYTERSTLNINQGLRANVSMQLCQTRSAAKDALAVTGRRKSYIHIINNQLGHLLSRRKQATLQFTRKWIKAVIRWELPTTKRSLLNITAFTQSKLVSYPCQASRGSVRTCHWSSESKGHMSKKPHQTGAGLKKKQKGNLLTKEKLKN